MFHINVSLLEHQKLILILHACSKLTYSLVQVHHAHIFHVGYFDGNNTFGIMKKGVAHSASDFDFMITAEVICSMPTSSGYLVKLTPQGQDNTTRYCDANSKLCDESCEPEFNVQNSNDNVS